MIINIENESIKRVYDKYMKSLNIQHVQHSKSKIVVNNTYKYNKLGPIPYNICILIVEQLIFFLQLLREENMSLIDFSPLYFEIGYSSTNSQQSGGYKRIESMELDTEYHVDGNLHLEINSQIPFIILRETNIIVPFDSNNDTFIIEPKQQKHIFNLMTETQELYNYFVFYHNTVLQKQVNNLELPIHIKDSYYSFSLMMYILLFGTTKQNIQTYDVFVSFLKRNIYYTPLYYCMLRVMEKQSNDRFLLLI